MENMYQPMPLGEKREQRDAEKGKVEEREMWKKEK
jgi:hypothetical protein